MSEFLAGLSTAPSRRHRTNHVTDEEYDRQLKDLIAYLKQPNFVPPNTNICEYLEAINPAIHSVSFLYLLRFEIHQVQKRTKRNTPDDLLPGGTLWKQAVRFLRSFDPVQVRYAGHEWRQLVELVASAADAVSRPVLAVTVIRDALKQLDSYGTFISLHLILVKLALATASYTHALPIMDKLIYQFPADTEQAHSEVFRCSEHTQTAAFFTDTSGFSAKLTYRDHLLFFLYSAMIYMTLKKWDQASHCLCVVISSPTTNSVSKIMVEAYKKLLLVNLLGYGKRLPTPKLVAPHVNRIYQSLARPYTSLAESFEAGDLQKMSAEIDLGQPIWRTDNNFGLVSQLPHAYDKFMIIKLGKTFSALAILDVLKRAPSCTKNPTDIEEFVSSLIMSNELGATLSQSSIGESTTKLRFSLRTQRPTSQEEYVRARLIRGRSALNIIAEGIAQTDHALELSHENLHFLVKNQRWSSNSEKPGTLGLNEDGGDIDEDLMGEGN
ncbi:hypothetical protein BJY04DRAFT_122138 [Aspergillus karnatakaensis]|uniref:putative COP9 subunit 3 n=1 Tax=Aspergillus karnatakaensis TaxID=1810916 RepID=UPI003CCD903F